MSGFKYTSGHWFFYLGRTSLKQRRPDIISDTDLHFPVVPKVHGLPGERLISQLRRTLHFEV